jgi:integrase
MRRPPKFVNGYIDRHGKPRFYFRRAGFKRVPLPGLPWSPEFMAAYQQALAGQPLPIGSARVRPGTIRALAVSYYNSLAFRSMKANTQSVYRNILDRFCREMDTQGQEYGEKTAAHMRRDHVVKLMAARAEKPDSANGLRKVLRALMQHAIEIGLRADDPTQGVKPLRPKSKLGFHRCWSEAEIAQFEARYPVGTKARLALALGLYTGQARQDVVAMGPQHIRDGVLNWTRGKTERTTGIELAIPVHPELKAVIDATRNDHLTFLVTEFGKPFTAAGFGNWFREQCDMANLRHCSFSWAAQGRLGAIGRSWMHPTRDRGDHRPRKLEGGRPIYSNGRPQTLGVGCNGKGQKTNAE